MSNNKNLSVGIVPGAASPGADPPVKAGAPGIITSWADSLALFLAPEEFDQFAIDESVSHLLPGFMEILPECLARYAQLLGCLFLRKPFKINEPENFHLIRVQDHPLRLIPEFALGSITSEWTAPNRPTANPWSSPAKRWCCFNRISHQYQVCVCILFCVPMVPEEEIQKGYRS